MGHCKDKVLRNNIFQDDVSQFPCLKTDNDRNYPGTKLYIVLEIYSQEMLLYANSNNTNTNTILIPFSLWNLIIIIIIQILSAFF